MDAGWRRVFRLGTDAHHVERAVDDEISFHLEMRTRKLIAAGLDPDSARAQAMTQFGDLAAVRAECLDIDHDKERAMERANFFGDLRQDTGYALRALRQHAGFASVVLLTLALGIGANTATFTLIDAVMLRTLPVPRPGELITVGNPTYVGSLSNGSPRANIFSYPLYVDLRDGNQFVTGLLASGRTGRLDVIVDEAGATGPRAGAEAEHPRGRLVSGNYFSVLGVPALVGRTLLPDDDRAAGASPVVVISHAYWQQRFGGERSVLGRTITVNGAKLTIVGVAPRGFFGDIVGQATDLWIPLMMQPSINPHRARLTTRDASWLLLMGRLKPGVTLAQARAGFTTLTRQALAAQAGASSGSSLARIQRDTVPVGPGDKGFSRVRSVYTEPLVTLMAAVVLVLLVVCANVANLMLARAAARGKEISVRMALGADRLRLVRQLLTESVILAAVGGALGLLLASWGSAVMLRIASTGPSAIPLDVHIDRRVLAFTVVLSLVTAILFGLVPALRATRIELATTLRAQGGGVTGGALGAPGRRFALGKMLVVLQVALSLVLIVGTSMLVRSVQRLESSDTGLARDELLIATVDATASGYSGPRLATLARTLVQRARDLSGVTAVSLSENGIFSGTESATTLQVDGFTARAEEDTVVNYDRVGPGYFHAIGARLLSGHDLREQDDERAARVAVVNATMARFYFPAGDAVGHHLRVDSTSYEIVGVVADTKDHGLRTEPVRRLYLSLFQSPEDIGQFTLELRTAGDPARLVTATRRALLAVDGSLQVSSVDALSDLMRQSISQDRLVARVVSFFGTLALALAALGLYGVMTYTALRRTSEFGLRMALGAEPRDVSRMVLGEAMTLVALGVLVGMPAALAVTRLLRNQLFGVALIDPASIAVALAVLTASAAVAGFLPATRAARVGPLVALRSE